MYHFFVSSDQIGEQEIRIEGNDVNHIRNVLRMTMGEKISISDSQQGKRYHCEIAGFEEGCVTAKILQIQEADTELSSRFYLFQGLPKSDKMELIIQKAVELGVYEVIPVATKRAIVKLDKKKEEAKRKRWNTIAESAAKQSKRMIIPEVTGVMTFAEALQYASKLDVKLIPYELAEGMDATRAILAGVQPGQSVAIFIGPEGGFDEKEIEQAQQAGIQPITLGRRILRTETAGMAILAALMLQLD